MKTLHSLSVPVRGAQRRHALALILLFLPTAVYLGLVMATAVNVPWGDDYWAVIAFLNRWHDTASGLGPKIGLLFEQYNSHRIVLTKLAVLADWSLFGQVNLVALQAVAWLGWAGLFAALVFTVPCVRAQPLWALPAALVMMQPQGYTNMCIAMQSVQNIGVVVAALGACFAASRASRRALALALLLAITAALTSANGLLVFPVLAWSQAVRGRRWQAAVAVTVGIVVWILFIWGYTPSSQHPFALAEFLLHAFVMLGAPFVLLRAGMEVAIVGGVLLLLVMSLLLLSPRTWREDPVLAMFLLFLFLTVFMAARGRIGWGADYMLQDRYRPYGILCVVVSGLILLSRLDAPRRLPAAITAGGLAALFCFFSYLTNLSPLLNAQRWAQATAINRQIGQVFLLATDTDWSNAQLAMQQAEARGIYSLPHYLSSTDVGLVGRCCTETAAQVGYRAVPNVAVCGYLLTSVIPSSPLPAPDFGVLCQAGIPLVLPTNVPRVPLGQLFSRRSLFSANHMFVLPKSRYLPGTYSLIGMIRDPAGHLAIAWSCRAECPPAQTGKASR